MLLLISLKKLKSTSSYRGQIFKEKYLKGNRNRYELAGVLS